jgi:hypothetical protein
MRTSSLSLGAYTAYTTHTNSCVYVHGELKRMAWIQDTTASINRPYFYYCGVSVYKHAGTHHAHTRKLSDFDDNIRSRHPGGICSRRVRLGEAYTDGLLQSSLATLPNFTPSHFASPLYATSTNQRAPNDSRNGLHRENPTSFPSLSPHTKRHKTAQNHRNTRTRTRTRKPPSHNA